MEPDSRKAELAARAQAELAREKRKRVKPLGEAIFGTEYQRSDKPKFVRPGDPEDTQANMPEKFKGINELKAEEQNKKDDEMRSFIEDARKRLLDRGYTTFPENHKLNRNKPKSSVT